MHRSLGIDSLPVSIFPTGQALAQHAAAEAAAYLRQVLASKGEARAILATGNSQISFISALAQEQDVDWSRITVFHMDEYMGLPADHSASFRRWMRERVESILRPKTFHYIEGDAWEPIAECDRYEVLLRERPIDLCCLGIGENGHLAFNDPPVADFSDSRWVKIVMLDNECRRQQVGEGHFPDLSAVPQFAISLTIPALCSAARILAVTPERRKAEAVRSALFGEVATACPASYLRTQKQASLFLDEESAVLLPGGM